CISRWAQHLALSELEITTLALAAMNAPIYFCWWNKPLNVLHPVPIHLKKPELLKEHPQTVDHPSNERPLSTTSPPGTITPITTSSDEACRENEVTSTSLARHRLEAINRSSDVPLLSSSTTSPGFSITPVNAARDDETPCYCQLAYTTQPLQQSDHPSNEPLLSTTSSSPIAPESGPAATSSNETPCECEVASATHPLLAPLHASKPSDKPLLSNSSAAPAHSTSMNNARDDTAASEYQVVSTTHPLQQSDHPSNERLLSTTSSSPITPEPGPAATSSNETPGECEVASATHPLLAPSHAFSPDDATSGPQFKPRQLGYIGRWICSIHAALSSFCKSFARPFQSVGGAIIDNVHECDGWGDMARHILFRWPMGYPFAELTNGNSDLVGLRIPTFGWKSIDDHETDGKLLATLLPITGGSFGAIHSIAWSFEFPSKVEQILWRSGTICVTGPPVLAIAMPLLYTLGKYTLKALIREWKSISSSIWGPMREWQVIRMCRQRIPEWRVIRKLRVKVKVPKNVVLEVFAVALLVCYVFARIILLILAVVTLRRLPPSAYETVQWSNLIPHI
ncbi:hypothetical protein H0H87_008071, partial [Tephrocybe sp. NHM501043]